MNQIQEIIQENAEAAVRGLEVFEDPIIVDKMMEKILDECGIEATKNSYIYKIINQDFEKRVDDLLN